MSKCAFLTPNNVIVVVRRPSMYVVASVLQVFCIFLSSFVNESRCECDDTRKLANSIAMAEPQLPIRMIYQKQSNASAERINPIRNPKSNKAQDNGFELWAQWFEHLLNYNKNTNKWIGKFKLFPLFVHQHHKQTQILIKNKKKKKPDQECCSKIQRRLIDRLNKFDPVPCETNHNFVSMQSYCRQIRAKSAGRRCSCRWWVFWYKKFRWRIQLRHGHVLVHWAIAMYWCVRQCAFGTLRISFTV